MAQFVFLCLSQATVWETLTANFIVKKNKHNNLPWSMPFLTWKWRQNAKKFWSFFRNQTIEFSEGLYCLFHFVLFLLLYVICALVPTEGIKTLQWNHSPAALGSIRVVNILTSLLWLSRGWAIGKKRWRKQNCAMISSHVVLSFNIFFKRSGVAGGSV